MTKKKGSTVSHQREVRTYAASRPLTIRTTTDGSKQVSGYAIVFNSPSVDLGGFTEICSPRMLDRTLQENPDVLAFRDHKQELLLGRTTAGTLELKTDSIGLAFTITLPKTNVGDDTAENVRLQNLTGCSFGFATVDDSWIVDESGRVVRTLLDVDLFEVSITSFPAFPATSVNMRSAPSAIRTKLSLRDESDDDDDDCDPDIDDDCPDAEDSEECSCECAACMDDTCDQCSQIDCDDETCDACPMQDQQRSDSLRVRSLFQHRISA
jgi:hypothetical protein